ncbi:hypothetical protein PBV87_12820 [Niameybacter massiliensis]|uniref:Uncharacterized protein n=1 Tax=Holtiella tumoricola TaxID=3018743 RepID=A0AA42DPF9_9FIRM|nr:hypothetical protein [Holtiella tumoricola]MDA3732371.1 hypothetical protein [Holtiella tumoricola]
MSTYEGEYNCRYVVNMLTGEISRFHGWIEGFAMISQKEHDPFGVYWQAFRTNFRPTDDK